LIEGGDTICELSQTKELRGKIIASQRSQEKQLFIATHSGNFIKGLMEAQLKFILSE